MNENAAMRALLRKDAKLILPLIVTGLISSLVCNLALFLIWRFWGGLPETLASGSIGLWVLMPGIVAVGAAAMLIGTEEESGTLRWLRTLPISWHQIAASKFIIGVGAFAVVWLFATLLMWLLSQGWVEGIRGQRDILLTFNLFATNLFFLLLLLFLGFVLSYWIRMPLAGLIVLIPVYAISAIGLAVLFDEIPRESRRVLPWGAFLTGAGVLVLLWLAQHALAFRRLTRPERSRGNASPEAMVSASRYRPPSFGTASKPSPAAALLWQQCRQTAPYSLALIGVSVLLMCVSLALRAGHLHGGGDQGLVLTVWGLAAMSTPLCASWLGALTFYGDNQHGRFAFFSDRGVSPSTVWWTRIVPPIIACILLLTLLMGILFAFEGAPGMRFWGGPLYLTTNIAVLFAFGQLVSQWVERPVLAFLAAPAYAFVSMIPIIYFYETSMQFYYPLIALTVPVLLFATWRLSGRWLAGNAKASYTVRVVAYTVVAIAIPCLLMAGYRLLAMPTRI